MKIDLEKELGLSTAPAPKQFPWLPVIAGLCVFNLVLVVVALVFSLRREHPVVIPPSTPAIVELNSQSVARIERRLMSLERTHRNMRISQKKSKKELTVVSAGQKVKKKRERMKERELKEAGLTDEDIRRALRRAGPGRGVQVKLTDEETSALDDLIDGDDSGDQVRAFIRGLSSGPKKAAYIRHFKKKGDQWFDAALQLLNDNDPDFDAYADNARYFYDIIADVSDNNAVIAYVDGKRNQMRLAVQNSELRGAMLEQRERDQEQIEALKEELRPRETAAQAQQRLRQKRRTSIKEYSSSGVVGPYETDWDPDPRVREERGIE